MFPANLLEKLFRDMYARRISEQAIEERIVERRRPGAVPRDHRVDAGRAGQDGAEPLGHRRQVRRGQGAPAGARGDRGLLRPGRAHGRCPSEGNRRGGYARLSQSGRVPRTLWPIGERLEPRFGKLGREYRQVVFDKTLLARDATWNG